jgi:hypothetical protein
MGMPRNCAELNNLQRGVEIIYRGIRTRCVYVHRSKSVVACFENGLVLEADEWSSGVRMKEKAFNEAKPEF